MHAHIDEYPPAPADRIADAERLFPYRSMPPEEYAAREGHNWLCFSYDEYVYPSPELNEWIHTLGDIFFAEGRLLEPRAKHPSHLKPNRELGSQED